MKLDLHVIQGKLQLKHVFSLSFDLLGDSGAVYFMLEVSLFFYFLLRLSYFFLKILLEDFIYL